MSISDRLTEIRERIASAARSAGRDPTSVRLVAVSKTFPIESIAEAFAAGQRDFGENRVQEALQKIELALQKIDRSADQSIRWHLLGHLQTNKARKAAPAFAMIQSVDSVELIHKLDQAAGDTPLAPDLLIQVDLAGETTKFGVPPGEVPRLFDAAAACRAARVVGLMTLPPFPDTPEESRPWFRQLRELSMGMSGDFEVAVQEGATIVRVGTAIFGSRHVEH